MNGTKHFFGVKAFAGQGDDAAAIKVRAHGRQKPGAVHQRRRGQVARGGWIGGHMGAQGLKGFGHGAQLAFALKGNLAHGMVGPHHPLGHACGSARIDEHLVIARALNFEGCAIAFASQGVEGFGKGRDLAVGADLDPGLDLGKPRPDLGYDVAKLGRIDNGLGI